jgi:hypothetical protein
MEKEFVSYEIALELKQLNSENFGLPKIGTKEFNNLASGLFGGKPKQETVEDAAENNWDKINSQYKNGLNPYAHKIGFIEGSEWMQERMYSEEDMRKAFIAGGNSQIEEDDDYGTEYDAYMEEWFEQFKKK